MNRDRFLSGFFLSLIFIFLITTSFAWNDCPYGRVNCTYPGECGRYIDTNHDGICDHSEPPPTTETEIPSTNNTEEEDVDKYIDISGKELKSLTIEQVCKKYNIDPECLKEKLHVDVPDDTTFEELKEKYGITPGVAKEAILECMIEEGKIKIDKSENINSSKIDDEKKPETLLDKIISFLFSTVNVRDLLFGWL
ncbi:conserved hypothetical protein [Methanocaldococcus vulcanius M7]|uniref:Uncharacterized protein n=1 Tax=Methanocaldococcus vulcanius (strain ATCC 700851 / DSM 12094 / M7) TaxID=579137 RepID=C9RFF7_METVM|nr:hypothetical protein [Methanocaldococcus vulcanius]ACX72309.1 conserved hypothetical protein [Methanocaldococcus vulcanius M7]